MYRSALVGSLGSSSQEYRIGILLEWEYKGAVRLALLGNGITSLDFIHRKQRASAKQQDSAHLNINEGHTIALFVRWREWGRKGK